MDIDVSAEQLLNAELPIVVTLFGMSTDASALQPLNARSPIEVTLLGMVTDLMEQLLNASSPIEIILYPSISDGISTAFSFPIYFLSSAGPSERIVYF